MELNEYRKDDILDNLFRFYFQIVPLDVVFVGSTGVGKSTTMNAILNRPAATIGEGVAPETVEITSYQVNHALRIWDTPGLGDSPEKDRLYKEKITSLLQKTYRKKETIYQFINQVVVIVDGSGRDLGTSYDILQNIIIPNVSEKKILIAINQADLAMKGRHWDYVHNKPDTILNDFLQEKAQSVQFRLKESTGINVRLPVCYSAKHNYNMEKIMDSIIDNM